MSYLYNCVITLEEMRCREIIYLINSGTCAKIFEKHLPAHKPAGASKCFFPGEGAMVDFSRWW